jgi:hypothetical protein
LAIALIIASLVVYTAGFLGFDEPQVIKIQITNQTGEIVQVFFDREPRGVSRSGASESFTWGNHIVR